MTIAQQDLNGKQICLVERDVFGLAERFLDRQGRAMHGLWAAMRQKDFEKIRKTGHDLKGSGGAYGLDTLSLLGTELELAAGAQDGGLVERLLARLEEKLSRIELRVASTAQQIGAADDLVAGKFKT